MRSSLPTRLALLLLFTGTPTAKASVHAVPSRRPPVVAWASSSYLTLFRAGERLPASLYGRYDISGAGGRIVASFQGNELQVQLQVWNALPESQLVLFYRAEPEPWEAVRAAWDSGDQSRSFGPWREFARVSTDARGQASTHAGIPLGSLPSSARSISFWVNRPVETEYGYTTATFLVTRSTRLPIR